MPIGEAQSHITAYCVPAGYSLWIKRVRAYMLDSGANQARLEYWVREFGGAVREIRDFAISTAYLTNIDILGGVKFPAKTDIVFQCTAINNANGYICVEWDGEIVKD
jgi:hypothetical protein